MTPDPNLPSALNAIGAMHHPGVVGEASLLALEMIAATLPADRAGIRLHGVAGLAELLSPSAEIGAIAAAVLGAGAQAVRAILFDKSAEANWSLAWHQDRTIVVRDRMAVPGYGPWTVKAGLQHVAPPFALLEGMMTLRIHLDPVTLDNAPLLMRRDRIARAGSPNPISTRSSRASVKRHAWPIVAISGPMRRRSCTHPTRHARARGAGCCRSTILPIRSMADWSGWGSDVVR